MTERNLPGEGSVEQLPSGRWSVRMSIPGRKGRRLPGTYATREEADEVRLAALSRLVTAGRAAVGGLTLRAFGEVAIDRWRLRGNRSTYDDRNMFRVHIATAHFADWPIQNIHRVDVKRWRDELLGKKAVRAITRGAKGARVVERVATKRPLSRQRVVNIVSVLRRIFREAEEDELVDRNPADDVYAPRAARTEEPWTFLDLEEQAALLAAVPEVDRPLVQFAMGSGMREGEIYALRLEDVHVDDADPYCLVRYGSRETAPKNGKIRRVALFGYALEAAREQLAREPRIRNRARLLFPGVRGGYRAEGKAPKGWTSWVRSAGIERDVRFHDMRHTCASALVSGMWGEPWPLEEVRDQLGHSSIKVTERYAHLAGSALKRRARATLGPRQTPAP